MGDCLSSTTAVECVSIGIYLCPWTFINSSELFVSLMALRSCWGTKTPFGLVTNRNHNAEDLYELLCIKRFQQVHNQQV